MNKNKLQTNQIDAESIILDSTNKNITKFKHIYEFRI